MGKNRTIASVVVSIAILAAGGIMNAALSAMKTPPAKDFGVAPATAVTTVVAQRQPYRERIIAYGKARPITSSEIAAAVSGEVNWTASDLEPGSFVQAGAELVRIDDRDLTSAVTAAQARLEQAKVALRRKKLNLAKIEELTALAAAERVASQRTYERVQQLIAQKAASAADVDTSFLQHSQREKALLELEQQIELAQPEIEDAEAEVVATNAALEQSQTDLERCIIRAPFSGYIEERFANLGSRVSPGTPLFQIVDTSVVEIPIALPASVYSNVQKGASVAVRLTEGGPVQLQARVERVSPMIHDEDRTFYAFIKVANSVDHPRVPAGAFVIAEVDADQHDDVFVVPRTAIVGKSIFVANNPRADKDTSVIEARKPVIRRLLTAVALLEGGIEDGESIVISNVEKIADGSHVIVTDRADLEQPSAHTESVRAATPSRRTNDDATHPIGTYR